MIYEKWLASVPSELTNDPLWKMEVYRLAVFLSDLAWDDVSKLAQDKRTVSLSDQLYRAVGSVTANIAEGYSRRSGKDQARFYEYSLGSAREARGWYYQGRHVLFPSVTDAWRFVHFVLSLRSAGLTVRSCCYAPYQAADQYHPLITYDYPR